MIRDMGNQFGKIGTWVLITLALLVVGSGGYFLTHLQTTSPMGTATTTPPVIGNTYGMIQYTDPDFGFTFWYPSSWQILPTTMKDTTSFPGGTLVKTLQVGSPGNVMIYIVDSSARTITDEQNGHASPIGQTKYFFDSTSNQWMTAFPDSASEGSTRATTTADVSNTTMSGLIMLPSGRRFDTSIIPLSTTIFLVVSDGGGNNAAVLAKTTSLIGVSVNPSVLSSALQTEATAYINTHSQACPQIAKQCLDGSYVGPTDANCTFVCPASTTQKDSGTLQGNMTIGPICPVEQVGHPCNPTPQMYAAHQVFVYNSSRTKLITTLIPDAQGNFSASLPVGTYLVDVQHQGVGAVTGVPATTAIVSGNTTSLSINIDTGIR